MIFIYLLTKINKMDFVVHETTLEEIVITLDVGERFLNLRKVS